MYLEQCHSKIAKNCNAILIFPEIRNENLKISLTLISLVVWFTTSEEIPYETFSEKALPLSPHVFRK